MSRNYYRHLIEATPPPVGPLFNNVVAYYKLDETSGQAIDVVNAYNASLLGGVTQGVAGKIGNAYKFNGSTGCLSVEDNNDFTMTNGTDLNDVPFTVRLWINFERLTGNQFIMNKRGAGTELEWSLNHNGTNLNIILYGKEKNVSGNVEYLIAQTSQDAFNVNQWYHLVVTYDGSKSEQGLTIYLNNINKTNTRQKVNNYQGMSNSNSNIFYGRAAWTSDFYFVGKLDEIAIIKNEAWTPAQVAEDYNNGLGTTI